MTGAKARLAALCGAAAYPEEVRELIAHATFPGHPDGQALSESKLTQLAEAVKVLVQAGLGAEEIPVLIAECRARDDARWRDEFWRQTLRAAAMRASHAQRRGGEPSGRRDQTPASVSQAAHRRPASGAPKRPA
jgi:hypothetical protein